MGCDDVDDVRHVVGLNTGASGFSNCLLNIVTVISELFMASVLTFTPLCTDFFSASTRGGGLPSPVVVLAELASVTC